MVLFILRCLLIFCLFVVYFISGGTHIELNQFVSRTYLWIFGIRKIELYGKLDPKARVLAFNHPSYLDAFILGTFVPRLSGLIRRSTPIDTLFGAITQSISVSRGGGERTSQRLKREIRKNKSRQYAIAINTMDKHERTLAGIYKNAPFQQFKTIPFVLGERVQPILIVYDSPQYTVTTNKYNEALLNLMRPMASHNSIRVYLLPSDIQGSNETPDDLVQRTKERMTRCLEKDWGKPIEVLNETELQEWKNTHYFYLSFALVLLAVGLILWTNQYQFAFLSAVLACITFFYHSGRVSSMYWLEKILILFIATKAIFEYIQMRSTIGGHGYNKRGLVGPIRYSSTNNP